MRAPLQVLLIGGLDPDVAQLTDALLQSGRPCVVRQLAGLETGELGTPDLVLVSLDAAAPSARACRLALQARGLEVPLIGLADLSQEALVETWLADGADDWVFRPHLAGLRAVLARLEREREEARARENLERRWRENTAALVNLANSPTFQGAEPAVAAAEVNEAAVRTLGVARCTVWLFEAFDSPDALLVQLDGYDARTGVHSQGARYRLDEVPGCPAELLRNQRLVSSSDVHHEPRLALQLAPYLEPQGIGANLELAIRLRGVLVGMLCLEHVGGPRPWHPGEESFAGALADLMALALESRERRRAEQALAIAEQRSSDLFQYSNDSILLYQVREDGRIECEDINPAGEVLTGFKRELVRGRLAEDVTSPQLFALLNPAWQQVVRTAAPLLYERELPLPSGARWVNTSIVPFLDEAGRVHRLAAISRDVSQVREAESLQRSLEAQMAEAQKNEALARLASHIAHDVNNLLTVIVAHSQRLQGLPGKAAEVAQAINQATARGRELTQQVLTFGRRRPPERKPLELVSLVRETLRLLEPTTRGVQVREVVGARVPRVLGDASQLHQVLTNLCTNALQAMPGGTGTLTLSLEAVEVDFAFASRHPPLQEGRWVRLTVSDTGVGMDPDTARRIFEPFFSTRLDGSGSGLGLAVVQSIVQGHDGAVLVDTQPGHGTAFHVYLPPLAEEQDRPGSGQHLMLVDDHPGMARVSARLLETLGYRTTVFDDPREALKAFEATPRGFDAVLTDLSMPQMSGEDFTRSLRALRPDVPVIVSSGMASELDDAERQRLRIDAVLVKPWRLEEAVAALQRVLD